MLFFPTWKSWGLRLNARKSVLSPLQRTTFLGVVWDSTSMQAHLSPARIESILSAVKRIRLGQSLTVKLFQRLLGLERQPLSHDQGHAAMPSWLGNVEETLVPVLGSRIWSFTSSQDANDRCLPHGLRSDLRGTFESRSVEYHHLSWHINRLEILAVFLALKNFLTDLRGHHVLVRSDNISVVSYINHQGGLRSRPLCKQACQILLWSQGKLLSLQATYIPGAHNIGADNLSWQRLRPGELRLHPEVVELIWTEFSKAQVDLFASRETSHCPLWFSLTHPSLLWLDAMVQTWLRLHLYAFPQIALLPEVLERVRRDRVPLLLNAPRWPGRVWFPDLVSLLDGPPLELPRQEGPSVPSGGLDISHPSRTMETVGLASKWGQTQVSQPRLLRPFSTPELHPRGNFMPWSGRFSLHGVVTISWTQSTAQLVQCWSSCKSGSLQG